MFKTMVVVIVSWVCAYVQTHEDVHIKSGQFLVYKFHLHKAKKKKIKQKYHGLVGSGYFREGGQGRRPGGGAI